VSVRRYDERRNSLFARELAGTDIAGFNLYRLGSGDASLKPCEMSAEKVRDFVLGLRLSASNAAVRNECPTSASFLGAEHAREN
jgi:hypothetical protein